MRGRDWVFLLAILLYSFIPTLSPLLISALDAQAMTDEEITKLTNDVFLTTIVLSGIACVSMGRTVILSYDHRLLARRFAFAVLSIVISLVSSTIFIIVYAVRAANGAGVPGPVILASGVWMVVQFVTAEVLGAEAISERFSTTQDGPVAQMEVQSNA